MTRGGRGVSRELGRHKARRTGTTEMKMQTFFLEEQKVNSSLIRRRVGVSSHGSLVDRAVFV